MNTDIKRNARVVVAIFLLVVAVGEILTFTSRSATASADSHAERFRSGTIGKDWIGVYARVVDVSPATTSATVRVVVIPHGAFAGPHDSLLIPLTVTADGMGSQVNFADHQIPAPLQLTLDLNGDQSQYPLDSYRALMNVRVTDTTTQSAIPTELILHSTRHDWKIHGTEREAFDGAISIAISASRATATAGFAVFVLLLMLLIAAIAAVVTFNMIVRQENIGLETLAWLVGTMFVLPAIRGQMPGVPVVGTIADLSIYFWCLLTVVLCIVAAGISYVRGLRENKS